MVARVTRPGPALRPLKAPGEQRRWPTMTAAQKCSFFPQEPYYIPGYGGFYPQVRYHVGQSYGRTTSRMLTDPEVRKSPCSVLTPLRRPKFTEDFSQQKLPAPDRMDQGQSYIPGYTGFVPYSGCFPIPGQDFQLPLPRVLLPLPDPPRWTHPAPPAAQRKVIPCHPGIRLACGPGWRQFAATASSQLVSPKGEQRFLCHPDIALVCGQEERRGPCKTGMSLVCGQGWRGPPCRPGTDQPTRTEGVPLPLVTETVDVRRFDRTPKLDLPNLIQRKAISAIRENYALTFGNSTRKAYYDEVLRRQHTG
ncbi:ciliary microtubule inner protein 2A isoform X4 [Pantherophis guttatus]|uniref:Ciliary microtubule inner protein 2A isoform X4 n=1 Tax=Pantherophis guttatus TaxID=94885 RepID=A0A6P9DIX3_PANGU|nr:ciliary microtubule inner protein 2A isoform X4 [Pantherophis guttatus]